MGENTYSDKIDNLIREQKKSISPKDYRFYLVDRFLKLMQHVDSFSAKCVECKHLKPEIEEAAANLAELINSSKTNKLKYEHLNDKILNHLNKIHRLKPKRYFTSLYSVYGIGISTILGMLTSFLISGSFSRIILFFLLIGLLVGNALGYRKDNQQKKNNLQL